LIQLSIALTYLFGFLAAISVLLFGASFSRHQRQRFPLLKKLDGKQVHLFIAAVVFLALNFAGSAWKDLLTTQPLEQSQGPRGEIIQKATTTGFKKELKEGAGELVSKAEIHFNAAEDDFATRRYQDAASNYLKSINIIPTMSAYLNRGISLWYISVFPQAQHAFISGLRMARKKQDKKLEAAFRGSIGNVYRNQGKLEQALESYEAALTIFKEIGNPQGQANALGNIGNVYFDQGKLEQALESHEAALTIHKEIGNPQGQANALGNIGKVYYYQGKYENAIRQTKSVLKVDSTSATAYYNLGCFYSLIDSSDKAIDYLSRGRKYFSEKIIRDSKTDSDFDNIREDPRFQQIMYGEHITPKN